MECQGIVLAGGTGSRMGRDKRQLVYRGVSLLQHACQVLQEAGLPVRIAVSRESEQPDLGFAVQVDSFTGTGPLGAIATALLSCSVEGCCFIPVDMPLLPPEFYRLLLRRSKEADVLIPRDGQEGLHPLCAYYSRRCVNPVCELLKTGERRVHALCGIKDLRTFILDPSDHGFPDEIFLNLNRPEDLAALQLPLPRGLSQY